MYQYECDYEDFTGECSECMHHEQEKDQCAELLCIVLKNLYSENGTIEGIEWHLDELAAKLNVAYPEGELAWIKKGPAHTAPKQDRVA